MTPFHAAVACLACLALGVLLTTLVLRRRSRVAGGAALASLGEIEATIRTLEQNLTEQRAETERTRGQRDEEARKAREYFERIDGVVTEANECRRLLVKTGAEHGAAQAMMLAEIDSIVHQYRALARQFLTATGNPAPRPGGRTTWRSRTPSCPWR